MSPASLSPVLLQAAGTAAPSGDLGPTIAFWGLTALTVGGALLTITRRNAVSAVMALVATFFGLAGLYLLLSAQFLAAIQVLVYAGAIMTLFVFVVMVLNRDEAEPWAFRGVLSKGVGVLASVYLAVAGASYLFRDVPDRVEAPPPGFGGVTDVGEKLFTTWLFPFEALSLMLLVAVIGAVVVARTVRRGPEDHAGGLAHTRPRAAARDADAHGNSESEAH